MIKFKSTTLAVLLGLALASPALAQTPSNISMTVGVCNPVSPRNCAKPDASGNLPVTIVSGDVDTQIIGPDAPGLPGVSTSNPVRIGGSTSATTNTGTVYNWVLTSAGAGTTKDLATGTVASTAPTSAQYVGANSSGNLTGLIQADASVKIDASTATTTQLVALVSAKKVYVTSWDVIAAGTGNVKLVYGTGTNCGTGTTDLTGNYNLTAQAGISKGNGLGPVLVVPAGNALCVTTSAAVQMSGSVAYTQF